MNRVRKGGKGGWEAAGDRQIPSAKPFKPIESTSHGFVG